jgi:Cys-tRNA(Pro) deacylase
MPLESYLQQAGIWHRFVAKGETVHTADAAAKTGLDIKRVAKSLVLVDQDKQPILAIIPGDCRLSFEKLRDALRLKKVRLVPFEEAEKYSGYPPGATPMVRHKEKMRVVIDTKLTSFETIYGGGGTRTQLLEMRTTDVITLNKALVADVTE